MQNVGLDKRPGFLKDAAERADTYQPVRSSIVLAQAAVPNIAADASPGAAPGGYIASNPEQWAGRPPVGTGECVPLVQQATGAPRSTQWWPGALVQGNTAIQRGTAIATFDGNGYYVGHTASYLRQDEHGVRVIDQWNDRGGSGQIISKQNPHERTIYFGRPQSGIVNQGERYHVVQ